MVGASLSLTPRPHLVSFLFLAITLHAWLGTARDLRPRWWLIALGWVWACSHGMWLLGPMVGLAVIGGLLLESRLPDQDAWCACWRSRSAASWRPR